MPRKDFLGEGSPYPEALQVVGLYQELHKPGVPPVAQGHLTEWTEHDRDVLVRVQGNVRRWQC